MKKSPDDLTYVRVRPAGLSDLATIQDINYNLFLIDYNWHQDLNVDWPYNEDGLRYFTKCIEAEDYALLVAEVDNRIVGYVAGVVKQPFSAEKGKRAELENMCVLEECRGHGIGGQLVDAFMKWAKDKEVDIVHVIAYTPNERAINFYKKKGFSPYALNLWQKIKK